MLNARSVGCVVAALANEVCGQLIDEFLFLVGLALLEPVCGAQSFVGHMLHPIAQQAETKLLRELPRLLT